jgi:hypothetical protein
MRGEAEQKRLVEVVALGVGGVLPGAIAGASHRWRIKTGASDWCARGRLRPISAIRYSFSKKEIGRMNKKTNCRPGSIAGDTPAHLPERRA